MSFFSLWHRRDKKGTRFNTLSENNPVQSYIREGIYLVTLVLLPGKTNWP